MAEPNYTLEDDGKTYLLVTSGRAQALVEALDIALASDKLDKRIKGVVTSQRQIFAELASGNRIERNPTCWVYVVHDIGPRGERLTKIGHARNIVKRFARKTDRPTPLTLLAAWRFGSVAEAMMRESSSRERYEAYCGGGGEEWVKADAERVVFDLTSEWGEPHWPIGTPEDDC